MGANPLEYLQFGQALRSGIDIGLRVQEQRDRRKMEEETKAYRAVNLELQRQQEKRMQQQMEESLRTRQAMEVEKAAAQTAAAQYALDVFDAVQAGRSPLEAHAAAIRKNPQAPQARNSITEILPKPKEAPTVTKLDDGGMLIPEGVKYVAPTKTATPQSTEFEFNAQGVPFFRNAKGEMEIPPGSEKIRESYLKDQKALDLEKRKLAGLEAQKEKGVERVGKTFGMGGRPIDDAISEAQSKIDEIMSKYTPGSRSQTAPKPSQPKKQAQQFKAGQRVRQNGRVYVFDGTDWKPE